MSVTIKAGDAEVHATPLGNAFRIIAERDGVSICMDVAKRPAEWARHMREMLGLHAPWLSNHRRAGAWLLSAQAYTTAVMWQVDYTERMSGKAVTVVMGQERVAPMPNYHGHRPKSSAIGVARKAAETAALAWVADVEARLAEALK